MITTKNTVAIEGGSAKNGLLRCRQAVGVCPPERSCLWRLVPSLSGKRTEKWKEVKFLVLTSCCNWESTPSTLSTTRWGLVVMKWETESWCGSNDGDIVGPAPAQRIKTGNSWKLSKPHFKWGIDQVWA